MRHHLTERTVRASSKDRLPLWSPTIYRPGAARGAAGVFSITCLVLDFDDGTPIEAHHAWDQWPHLVHTSWSHTADHPKWRLVVPLAVPVRADDWPLAYWVALDIWQTLRPAGAGMPDAACSDPCRIYYLPAERPGYRAIEADDGELGSWPLCLLPVDTTLWRNARQLMDPPRAERSRPAARRINAESMEQQVRSALRTDPALRRAVAERLGGTIIEDRGIVRGITCPSCGRPDVWYVIDPARRKTAKCNHQNSCGWWGHLDEIPH